MFSIPSAPSDLDGRHQLAEALPHLVWFARRDGTVTYYNRRIELYGGLGPDEHGVYDWAPIVHPDDLDRTSAAWQAAVDSLEQYECEHRVRMADGSFRWHLSRALPLESDEGLIWFGTATDTHALVETREALEASEGLLRSVFSAIDQGYCVCELVVDELGHPVDYLFLETNEVFEHTTGLRDAVGRTALELVPALEDHWVRTYAEVALGGAPLRFQQGSQAMGRCFDVFATPVAPRGRFALVFTDITERQAALEALAESERRFRNMADHAPVMIWLTDADGTCTYLNRRWFEFTGQDEHEALGVGWLDATHPEDRPHAAARFGEAVDAEEAFSIDYRLRRRDGVHRWVVDAAAPRFNDDGRFLGHVGSVLDITDRKVAEQATARQRDREHDIAVRLQQSMLPTALLDDDRIEVAAEYMASADFLQVGGDWYETFHTGDGRIGVVVGDVVGHNTAAAAAMGQLRAGVLALASRAAGPGQLLDELDRFARSNRITDFATATCVFLDPDSGEVEYSSAAHPPSLICHEDGTVVWLDSAGSLPLVVGPEQQRPAATATMGSGCVLVAYSDGLVERRGSDLDDRLAQLAQLVRSSRAASMSTLCRRTLAALEGGAEDDTVLLALRRR